MSTCEHQTLPIDYYLARLPQPELSVLFDWAERLEARAPRFGRWLQDEAFVELSRRRSLYTNEPREATRPDAACWLDWSDHELGETLTAIVLLSSSTRRYATGEFGDRLLAFCTALVAHRLSAHSQEATYDD